MFNYKENPKTCNLCNGEVIYTTNAVVYGKPYGSGYCYICKNCGAYVGTHKPYPRIALGILADANMRKLKMQCHEIFDKMWHSNKERNKLYAKLASELNIPIEDCHFGHFNMEYLIKAYEILKNW